MKKLTALAGLCWLPCALAQNTSTTTPIKHVVVIFQENVSFDHYFATYPNALNTTAGEPTFKAAPNTPTVNGLTGALLTNNPNSINPVRLSRAQAVTCDQNHNYTPEQMAIDSGLMDLFPQFTGKGSTSASPCNDGGYGTGVVMAYYDGNTVTGMWNYAQNYAMSDNSYGTTFGPSTPGAMHLIMGNAAGVSVIAGTGSTTNVVSEVQTLIGDARPPLALDDCTIKADLQVQFSGKHVGDLLNAKNISWGWFQGGFRPSAVSGGTATCATAHNNISGASAGADYIPHHQPFQFFTQSANIHHLPPTSTAMIGTSADQANHQYDTIDFFNALAAGNMPAVSYLKAPAYQDGHPGYSDPVDEQTFVVNTINTIMASPYWSSTAIIIAYDDSDGWYDHQMGPIVTPSNITEDNIGGAGNCGNGTKTAQNGRCGYGPRLPLLVISPYSKVNYVDHTVTDQSSILKFIEDNWTLGRIGGSSVDAIAGSINGMFNFNGTAPAVFLDPTTGQVTAAPPNTGTGTTTAKTTAVANPKNATISTTQTQLDGTQSISFDGKPLQYLWTLAPGSLPAGLTGGNTATPTVYFGPKGGYSFILTVTDSAGNTSTDTATINFEGN